MYKYHRVDDKMSKMRGGGPEKRRAVPKKERHGSLFLYRDNQTTQPRTHLGSITQLWWRRGIGKVSHWERDSCGFNPLLCLRIVPSSGVFVRRQISMCAAFVRLPLYTRPTSTYKALTILVTKYSKNGELMVSIQIKGPQKWYRFFRRTQPLMANVATVAHIHSMLILSPW